MNELIYSVLIAYNLGQYCTGNALQEIVYFYEHDISVKRMIDTKKELLEIYTKVKQFVEENK